MPPAEDPCPPGDPAEAPTADLLDLATQAAALLEQIAADRARLAALPPELRRRLLTAAGRASRPQRDQQRAMAKELRRKDKRAVRDADDAVLARSEIRRLRAAPVFPSRPPVEEPALPDVPVRDAAAPDDADQPPAPKQPGATVTRERKCYVCKASYRDVHAFYDQLCPPCATLNWSKRNQTADLSGRVALVTGARVKIGYQAALKLLRAGSHVVVTTRFPKDAALRYANEPDFERWRHRLSVHGLDLRHTPSVEAFASHMGRTFDRLDFILNNACQTVRRPPGFYAHLMQEERRTLDQLPAAVTAVLAAHEALRADRAVAHAAAPVGVMSSAELSQLALLPDDAAGADLALFPQGQLDQDLQQIDLRAHNSWRLPLADVPTIELLEVQLVNAVAPFVLNARLKPLMLRVPSRDKHIVNVSAMEGQFYRSWKTDKHPHTNMAKAALNMMTRTSAVDYLADGIHMNSVDTGWVTDEDPRDLAERKVREHGFHPPLDIVDGAARIVDPIFTGLATGQHVWGQFLKDYKPTPW